MVQLAAITGIDNSVQCHKHYHDDNVTDGVVDVSSGDITFKGKNGVLIRSNDGGDVKIELVSDRAETTGTIHTLNAGETFPGRVRKIHQTGTDATGLTAII